MKSAEEFKSPPAAGEGSLENEYFRVKLNPKTGWLESLYDKTAGRELLQGPANVLQAIVDEPESMSAWELGLKDKSWNIGEDGAKIEVLESGSRPRRRPRPTARSAPPFSTRTSFSTGKSRGSISTCVSTGRRGI